MHRALHFKIIILFFIEPELLVITRKTEIRSFTWMSRPLGFNSFSIGGRLDVKITVMRHSPNFQIWKRAPEISNIFLSADKVHATKLRGFCYYRQQKCKVLTYKALTLLFAFLLITVHGMYVGECSSKRFTYDWIENRQRIRKSTWTKVLQMYQSALTSPIMTPATCQIGGIAILMRMCVQGTTLELRTLRSGVF